MTVTRLLAPLGTIALVVGAACSGSSGAGAKGDSDAGSGVEAGLDATGGHEAGGGVDSGAGGDTGSPAEAGATETGAPEGGAADVWVMGYFSSWDSTTNGGFYPISSIDWAGLTHVAAAFYIPDGAGGWASGSFDDATAIQLIAAAHASHVKAIASIGGAGSGPGFEGSMQSAMSTFTTALQALLTMGYDGLDIDWEGGNLTAAQDQALETTLVTGLRTSNPTTLVTLTAGIVNENAVPDLSFYGTIAPQLDRINLMTYGMSGAYQGWKSWHSSPLHWDSDTSTPTGIDATVAHYLAASVPAGKLGVGSGFYGECYTSPVTAPSQVLGASTVAADDNTMSYRNIMGSYFAGTAYSYDPAAQVPYLTLSGNNAEKCTYVSYEDVASITAKGAWLEAQGLGSIIIWTISEGYLSSGTTVAEQNPLLEAMRTTLLH
jgi:chitinase